MIRSAHDAGFTLLEMLVALAVFALIAGVSYAALVPAGEGFRMLKAERDKLESSYLLERQLRMDTAYIARSADKALISLQIEHDQRGSDAFDMLTILVADGESVAPQQVRYAIDEANGMLVRESAMAWLRDGEPLRWDMQKCTSFEVQALTPDGRWQDDWKDVKPGGPGLPAAIRVRWRSGAGPASEAVLRIPIAQTSVSSVRQAAP